MHKKVAKSQISQQLNLRLPKKVTKRQNSDHVVNALDWILFCWYQKQHEKLSFSRVLEFFLFSLIAENFFTRKIVHVFIEKPIKVLTAFCMKEEHFSHVFYCRLAENKNVVFLLYTKTTECFDSSISTWTIFLVIGTFFHDAPRHGRSHILATDKNISGVEKNISFDKDHFLIKQYDETFHFTHKLKI